MWVMVMVPFHACHANRAKMHASVHGGADPSLYTMMVLNAAA